MERDDDREEIRSAEEKASGRDLRRDVLGYALANAPREPRRHGIHAFEVCQQCGEIGTYSGLWGAIGSHGTNGLRKKDHPLPPGAFVAGGHDHSDTPLHAGRRFCEICRDVVHSSDADEIGCFVLCRACSRAVRKHGTGDRMLAMLHRFTRYRWRYHGLIEDEIWKRGR
ncbi:MAG: hypothetical protein M9938_05810 [Solirubrobacterales bacterium]|nr:hypothetical protein [Solirubrobacterales bacterium]